MQFGQASPINLMTATIPPDLRCIFSIWNNIESEKLKRYTLAMFESYMTIRLWVAVFQTLENERRAWSGAQCTHPVLRCLQFTSRVLRCLQCTHPVLRCLQCTPPVLRCLQCTSQVLQISLILANSEMALLVVMLTYAIIVSISTYFIMAWSVWGKDPSSSCRVMFWVRFAPVTIWEFVVILQIVLLYTRHFWATILPEF